MKTVLKFIWILYLWNTNSLVLYPLVTLRKAIEPALVIISAWILKVVGSFLLNCFNESRLLFRIDHLFILYLILTYAHFLFETFQNSVTLVEIIFISFNLLWFLHHLTFIYFRPYLLLILYQMISDEDTVVSSCTEMKHQVFTTLLKIFHLFKSWSMSLKVFRN